MRRSLHHLAAPVVLALAVLALGPPVAAGPAQDGPDIGDLVKQIEAQEQSPNRDLLEQLGQAKSKPAFRALARIADDLDGLWPKRHAFSAMRHFMEVDGLADDVVDHVAKAARSRDETEARAAAGALAWFGPKAHDARELVLLRGQDDLARASVLAGLRQAFAANPTDDALELVLEVVQSPQSGTRQQIIELLRAFRDEDSFDEFAKFIGSRGAPMTRKRLVIDAMSGHPVGSSEVVDVGADRVLSEAAEGKDPILQYYALTAMARRGGTRNERVVERLARAKDPTVRRAALLVGARSGVERAAAGALAQSSDPIARQAATIVLGEADDDASLELLHRLMTDEDRIVRGEAIRAVLNRRDLRSIPFLIDRMDDEQGRLVADLSDALQTMTGRNYGRSQSVWQRFWEAEGDAFALPTEEQLAEAKKAREKAEEELEAAGMRSAVSFYGIEVVSNRFALIIDTSGSMSAAMRPGRYVGEEGTTRIEVAKEQLRNTLRSLADGVLFNIIPFSNGAYAYEDFLVELSEEERSLAGEYVDALQASGGTNIHDAIEAAFRDPEVDTIYLLSDGSPSAGPITDAGLLRDEVARWNSIRGIRIHCVAVGQDHPLLRGLAEDSGGKYIQVK